MDADASGADAGVGAEAGAGVAFESPLPEGFPEGEKATRPGADL